MAVGVKRLLLTWPILVLREPCPFLYFWCPKAPFGVIWPPPNKQVGRGGFIRGVINKIVYIMKLGSTYDFYLIPPAY